MKNPVYLFLSLLIVSTMFVGCGSVDPYYRDGYYHNDNYYHNGYNGYSHDYYPKDDSAYINNGWSRYNSWSGYAGYAAPTAPVWLNTPVHLVTTEGGYTRRMHFWQGQWYDEASLGYSAYNYNEPVVTSYY